MEQSTSNNNIMTHVLQQIEEEYQAARQGLYGYASVAQHIILTARTERIALLYSELQQVEKDNKEVFMSVPSLTYHSSELEQIQQNSNSPFGMQFLRIPTIRASVPSYREEASTRTCDETSNDGSSKLDCIDDDD